MQSYFKTLFIICSAALMLASCSSKTNKQGKMIPREAFIVFHINGASLNEKLPWEEIKQNEIFKTMQEENDIPEYGKKILDNPENSGIDIKADMLIFGVMDSSGAYFSIQGNVKDEGKFGTFNKEITDDAELTEKDGIKYIKKDEGLVGWNKEKFIYVIHNDKFSRGYDVYNNKMKKKKSRDLEATCKMLFDLSEKNSLATDKKFTALMQKEGDLHIWYNTEEFYKSFAQNNDLGGFGDLMNVDEMYKDNRVTATINFDKGKITAHTKYYTSSELGDVYKKYQGDGISEDMIKRIPSKNLVGLFITNYKPEMIKEIAKSARLDGLISIALAFAGFNLDDIEKATKGDLMIALTDIKEKTVSYPSYKDSTKMNTFTTTEPDILFSVSIRNKNMVKTMIEKLEKRMGDELPKTVNYKFNDDYLVISNNAESVDKYLTSASSDFDFIKKIKDYPIAGYLDIQYLMKKFEKEATKDSTGKAIYDLSLKMWDNAYLMGGKFNDGGIEQNFELNLLDKNTNSLKQLNTYTAAIIQLQQKAEKERAAKYEEQYKKFQQDDVKDTGVATEVAPPSTKK